MQLRNNGSSRGNSIRMAWTGWSDQAFENQLTLVNWFPSGLYPGGRNFNLKKLNGQEVIKAVAARKAAAEFPDNPDSTKVLCIVSWSEGMDWIVSLFILS
jgi:hypothetical protein